MGTRLDSHESGRISRKRYFVAYTLLFLIVCGLVYSYFIINGKSFIYNDDGWKQHFKAVTYYAKWLRSIVLNLLKNHTLEIPQFSFSIGYGSDILTTLHYYAIGDPLNVFGMFVPTRYMEYFYSGLIIIRLYLAGLTFSGYCFYRNTYRNAAVMAGAISYAFCVFSLFAATRHPYFINPMIYLPLLLLGVEKIIKEKKTWIFILSVCVSAMSSFYFFYMLVLLTVLYVMLRLLTVYRLSQIKQALFAFVRIGISSIVGVMMSAVILLPVIRLFLNNPRSGNTVEYSLLYSRSYYEKFWSGFVTYGSIGSWNVRGYTAIALCAVILLFLCRKRYTSLKAAFIILTGFLLLPTAGYLFNGFSYVSNRWVWGYSMLISFILTVMWEEFWTLSRKKRVSLCSLVAVYFAYCFWQNQKREVKGLTFALVIALVMLMIVLIFSAYGRRWKKVIRDTAALGLVVINIAGLAYYGYSADQHNDLQNYLDGGNIFNKLQQTEARAIYATGDEGEFYRYSGDVFNTTNANSSMLSGLSSVQFYWSLSNSEVASFMEELCLRDNSGYNYKTLDNRTILNTLAGVKYYITKDESKETDANYVPYGFDQLAVGGKADDIYNVYKNKYTLPLGYTYSAVLSASEYEQMNALEKQEALLQGILLEDIPDGFEEAEPELTVEEMEYEVVCNSDTISQQGNSFVVTKANSSVTLEFDGLAESETYLLFEGLNFAGVPTIALYSDDKAIDPLDLYTEEKYNSLSEEKKESLLRQERYYVEPTETVIEMEAANAAGQISRKQLEYRTPRYTWYAGRHDFAINMCYDELPKTSITITFPKIGTYSFESLDVICQPMKNYAEQVELLREDTLKNVDMHNDNIAYATNEVTGTISLSEPKILCLTVPYSEGWTAYVDGEKQEILQANTMFMALDLEAGEHEIHLVYHTPGMAAGAIISCAGIGCFILLEVLRRKANRNVRSSR